MIQNLNPVSGHWNDWLFCLNANQFIRRQQFVSDFCLIIDWTTHWDEWQKYWKENKICEKYNHLNKEIVLWIESKCEYSESQSGCAKYPRSSQELWPEVWITFFDLFINLVEFWYHFIWVIDFDSLLIFDDFSQIIIDFSLF